MRTPELIAELLYQRERDYAWLSRATGILYKKLLRTAKHGEQPLSLMDAVLIADALEVDLPALIPEKAPRPAVPKDSEVAA